MDIRTTIDWAPLEKYERNTIGCICGAFYVSHFKLVKNDGLLHGVSKDPCPACGKYDNNARRVESPPERCVIGPADHVVIDEHN